MTTNFNVKIGEKRLIFLYSSPWYSETDSNIALLILKGLSTMIWLHRIGELRSSNSRV